MYSFINPHSCRDFSERQLLLFILDDQKKILHNQEKIMDNLNTLVQVNATIASQVATLVGQGPISPAVQSKIDAALASANTATQALATLITPAA